MDRSKEATELFEQAMTSLTEPWAIFYLNHSLSCEWRSNTFLEIAKRKSKLGWSFANEIEAGLRCAEFEGNQPVYEELLELRAQLVAQEKIPKKISQMEQFALDGNLSSALDSDELSRLRDKIVSLAQPCMRITRSIDPSDTARSKFGGTPLGPLDFQWPISSDGNPLSFVCQIDCATIPNLPPSEQLPSTGLLSFFFDNVLQPWGGDPSEANCWRVYYFPESMELTKAKEPSELESRDLFLPCVMSFLPTLSLPDQHEAPEVVAMGLSDVEKGIYYDFVREWHEGPDDNPVETSHQLLGYPILVQNDWRPECAFAANGVKVANPLREEEEEEEEEPLANTASEWQLLLQVDSDDLAGFLWGDTGKLYFAIRSSDLVARNFDRCWVILQCH